MTSYINRPLVCENPSFVLDEFHDLLTVFLLQSLSRYYKATCFAQIIVLPCLKSVFPLDWHAILFQFTILENKLIYKIRNFSI